tara:strand:+ start:708 stop:1763 length:1056 start_codon:yes stop_codon:yes gene_type:complete
MKTVSSKLIKWYKKNNFLFPWRLDANPYNIWISEIMLQQTQVKTVIPYYNKWMKSFSSIDLVAKAHIDIILKHWEGLGYYRRAHNLHQTAQTVVENFESTIPNNYNKIIKLNGIGDYTASAILSIAYNKKYPAIDGNLKRVISRIIGISDFKNVISKSKQYVLELMEYNQPSLINQSLMDLGREICVSKNPKCDICPVSKYCKAFCLNKISFYSFKNITKPKPLYNISVGIIWKNNKILINKRKKGGILGGLWELPGGKEKNQEDSIMCLYREIKEEVAIIIKKPDQIGTIKHHFSHFSINLTGYHCLYHEGLAQPKESEEIKWITPEQIIQFPFPRATVKLFLLAGLLHE